MIDARGVASLRWVVPASLALALPIAWLAASHLGLALVDRGVVSLLIAVIVSPLLEELVLRRLVQREVGHALVRQGMGTTAAGWTAAVFATVVFALMHLPAWRLDALTHCAPWLMPGAALAATWCWRRRTLDCVVLHACFNVSLWVAGPA